MPHRYTNSAVTPHTSVGDSSLPRGSHGALPFVSFPTPTPTQSEAEVASASANQCMPRPAAAPSGGDPAACCLYSAARGAFPGRAAWAGSCSPLLLSASGLIFGSGEEEGASTASNSNTTVQVPPLAAMSLSLSLSQPERRLEGFVERSRRRRAQREVSARREAALSAVATLSEAGTDEEGTAHNMSCSSPSFPGSSNAAHQCQQQQQSDPEPSVCLHGLLGISYLDHYSLPA